VVQHQVQEVLQHKVQVQYFQVLHLLEVEKVQVTVVQEVVVQQFQVQVKVHLKEDQVTHHQ
tara:strand:- start:400 stop:582 length:183 start_codon:yes stop_codon:yes gene_type:complete